MGLMTVTLTCLVSVLPVIITDTVTGRQTRQLVYICHKASSLLLSLEACENLSYVNKNFTAPEYIQFPSNATTRASKKPDCDCECPVRETAPDAPTAMPHEPIPRAMDQRPVCCLSLQYL